MDEFVAYASVANVRSIGFLFFLSNFGKGPIREYYIYRLVPILYSITTSRPFVQIQRNQRPLLRYDPLYPVIQIKHVFESLKFEFKQICIRTLFDRNSSFITPFELILFAN